MAKPVKVGTTANDDTITLTTASPSVMSFLINPADLLGNDVAGDKHDHLSIISAQGLSGGHVEITPNGQLQVFPTDPFHPSDTFRYTISDGHGGTASAVATVNYSVANSPPVAVDDNLTTRIGLGIPQTGGIFAADVLANDHDANGDPLSVVGIGQVTPLESAGPRPFNEFDPAWKVELLPSTARSQINITTPTGSTFAKIGFDYIVADNHGGFDTGHAIVSMV